MGKAWGTILVTKDETSGILKKFITKIENLKDLKVKIIRTPQRNGVAKRRNRTLIESARKMLADAKLPVTFWAKAVNTACYVQNMVLVNKSQNKSLYELFNGNFKAKGDEGYFIGYSMSSKALIVFNKRTRRVEENLHVELLENKAIKKGASPNWLFDINSLTKSMNYVHDALLESSSSKPQDGCSPKVPESSGITNPTASTSTSPADQMETLTVETFIPTISSPVPTACFIDSLEPSRDARPISKRVANKEESPSMDNILSLTNWFEDTLGNKKDERGIVVRNKARLVAQGHTQEEGIDYNEVFAPVTRIEAIRLFLAYASFMGFTVYQMDVKSAFLYGTIDEEVYVIQPLGFQEPEFPAKVYKVEKAMYGLDQSPRAWYGTLSKYLLMNGFQRGQVCRRYSQEIQVYRSQIFKYPHRQEESLRKGRDWKRCRSTAL
nr:hypothetical protein [Tanacetum cinerariifolium]